MYAERSEPIVLRRIDIQKELAYPKPIRDQLVHLLAAHMGFRTGEIASARIEKTDLDSGTIMVLDSKKYKEYPIPIDYETAKLMQVVIEDRKEGWLIQRHRMAHHGSRWGKPLTDTQIWNIVRRYAIQSQVLSWQSFNPRLLRHYFAATFSKGKNGNPGNLEVLRRILRHKSLAHTQIYLSRLIFWEDIQDEFNRLQQIPQIERRSDHVTLENENLVSTFISQLYQEYCCVCKHQGVCRFIEEAARAQWAGTCRHFEPDEIKIKERQFKA